ncbi:restriction endonuclease subunit S [Delftia tsuruhatensis]|uniref:restriction endonuclease subunit S n=1 Tax=Delftia tsuruhatensis TaxID=180282 RepID=UPI0020903CF9|nr:restriction endonuclease subunit S [Delftia tsuruhatensis]MCO5337601.1 restriction endonuclease subunit S [Delftia tsuruhatensis]MCR4545114.1 restriction endonuclease subunit S [Delftia tsuruhatensis]
MSSEPLIGRFTISQLIELGAIVAHKDGNFGSLYPKIEDFVDDGYPLLTAKVVNYGRIDFEAAQRLNKEKAALLKYGFIQPNDVLLSHNATVGRVAVVPDFPGFALVGTSLTYFRVDKAKLLPRYLAAFFESRDFQNQLSAVMGLSTRNQVPITAQRLLEVEVPALQDQVNISEFVGALDDRITLLRETNATLEAIAQALFKSWFVDFEPVRAKMEGRTPEGMDEATAALFPDGFETSELGEVPKGWRVGTVASVALLNAQSLSPRNPPPEINYLDLAGVKANVFDVPQCYSFADAPSRARRVLQEGDCIVGTVRPGNRSFGFIATAQNHLIGSTGFAVLSPKQHWMTAFTYLCATRDESIDRLASLADGGAYPAVRPDVVASTPCTLPPDEVMKVFDGAARPLLDAIGANSEQAQTLSTLRDTLLPRLISGQLRLDESAGAIHA